MLTTFNMSSFEQDVMSFSSSLDDQLTRYQQAIKEVSVAQSTCFPDIHPFGGAPESTLFSSALNSAVTCAYAYYINAVRESGVEWPCVNDNELWAEAFVMNDKDSKSHKKPFNLGIELLDKHPCATLASYLLSHYSPYYCEKLSNEQSKARKLARNKQSAENIIDAFKLAPRYVHAKKFEPILRSYGTVFKMSVTSNNCIFKNQKEWSYGAIEALMENMHSLAAFYDVTGDTDTALALSSFNRDTFPRYPVSRAKYKFGRLSVVTYHSSVEIIIPHEDADPLKVFLSQFGAERFSQAAAA